MWSRFFLVFFLAFCVDVFSACWTKSYTCTGGYYCGSDGTSYCSGYCRNGAIGNYGRCQGGEVKGTACIRSLSGSIVSIGCSGDYLSAVCKFCDTGRQLDSALCVDAGKYWNSAKDTCQNDNISYHCQNSGGSVEGGIGGPRVAKLFKCEGEVCTNTRDLSGTCQDWGFCPDGVEDCNIDCGSSGCPPCGRSGPGMTSTTRCYYSCADGRDLSCVPTSTQYVAGSIYVGTCPDSPPSSCLPSSASSSASVPPSSSASVPPSSSASFARDTVELESGKQLDYSAVLQAIHDTLHHANVQRDFQSELQVAANNSFNVIANYAEYNYGKLERIAYNTGSIKSTFDALSNDGFSLVSETADDISQARNLLDEINRYLRSDSLLRGSVDTAYNPLLRDIKGAIDSIDVVFSPSVSDSMFYGRDTAFGRWWANYYADSASSRGFVGRALDAVAKNFSVDSSKSSNCSGFYDCMTVYKNMAYCKNAWGVSPGDCVAGGTPVDGVLNIEGSILETVWDGFFGSDSSGDLDTFETDTNYILPASVDSAKNSVISAISAMFSEDSVNSMMNRVMAMKDSAESRKNDTVRVQPDSLWLDSSNAASYVQNLLLPPGTSNTCFVCHADLGNFGGFLERSLSIHIDFGNFGGFDWCSLIRAVVKIVSFVVCLSLTLGSWAAAFGYNPKNDT